MRFRCFHARLSSTYSLFSNKKNALKSLKCHEIPGRNLTCSRAMSVSCPCLLGFEAQVWTPSSFGLWRILMRSRQKLLCLLQISTPQNGLQSLASLRLLASTRVLLALCPVRGCSSSSLPARFLSILIYLGGRGEVGVARGILKIMKGVDRQAHSLLMRCRLPSCLT